MTQPVCAGAGGALEPLPLPRRGTNARDFLTPTRWLRPHRDTTTGLSLALAGFQHPLAVVVLPPFLAPAAGRTAK